MEQNRLDPYIVLNIQRSATPEELRSAYRAAAMKAHPDRYTTYVQKIWATRQMQQINEAYSILRDPAKRRVYDNAHPNIDASVKTKSAVLVDSDSFSWKECGTYSLLWILTSLTFVYFMARHDPPQTAGRWVSLLIISIYIAPVIWIVIGCAIAMPFAAIAIGFQDAFSEHYYVPQTKPTRILWDVITRLLMLAIIIGCIVGAIRLGIVAELVYLLLLSLLGSVLGELVAMAGWFFRARKVVTETTALLKI